jgi:hypothetical protein
MKNNIQLHEWEETFNGVFNESNYGIDDTLNLLSMLADYPRDIPFGPIMREEVLLALRKMINNKAPGPDSVRNENLKILVEHLLDELTQFFNICVLSGKYPQKRGGIQN